MADTALTQLGRYRLVAELGRGAMGIVYRAEDPLLNRMVAIKTIIMSTDPEERSEYEARFYQEARAAGGLSHPNLITIHDIGREGNTAYMAMELLDGTDLREMLKQEQLPLALALELIAQVADGLACAHEHGVVHRDIKPANVMVIHGRRAKIMDFGIAHVRVSDVRTQTGAILGSPRYLSPEQVGGLRADHRSDIFSLGIVLYELVSGSPPFSAPTVTGLMHEITTATPRPVDAGRRDLPSMLDLIVARALQKEPDARYQSAAEMAADLRVCLSKVQTDGVDPAAQERAATASLEKIPALELVSQGMETTAKLDATSMAAPVHSTVTARTRQIDAITGSRFGAGAVAQLYLSRRADSSEAMKRLESIAAQGDSGAGGDTPGVIRRIWRDPDQRIFAAAMAVALCCAVFIAVS